MTNIRFRDPVSAISHYAGALLSIVAMSMVIYSQRNDISLYNISLFMSSLVFTASMFMLYLASGIYHTRMAKGEACFLQKAASFDDICAHCWFLYPFLPGYK